MKSDIEFHTMPLRFRAWDKEKVFLCLATMIGVLPLELMVGLAITMELLIMGGKTDLSSPKTQGSRIRTGRVPILGMS